MIAAMLWVCRTIVEPGVPGGTYFFTVAIAERSKSLLVERKGSGSLLSK
jgi:hypothetical protein